MSSELVGSQEILSGHGQDDVRARAKSKSVLTSFDEFVFDQLDIGRVDILLKLLTNCLLEFIFDQLTFEELTFAQLT